MPDQTTIRSVRSLLKHGIDKLRTAQVASYTLAAELLLLHVANRDRTWIYSHPEEDLSDEAAENYYQRAYNLAPDDFNRSFYGCKLIQLTGDENAAVVTGDCTEILEEAG